MVADRRRTDAISEAGSSGIGAVVTASTGGTGMFRVTDRLARCIAERPSRTSALRDDAPAGVLVMLFPGEAGALTTILTRRTETVRDHKGQISFPGGVRDAVDADLAATALRETSEEVGVGPGAVCLVGRLDDYRTMTGYLIRPFVAYLPARPAIRANPVEIAETIPVALCRLLAPGVHELRKVEAGTRVFESHVFTLDPHVIWGATAAILMDLLQRIERLL